MVYIKENLKKCENNYFKICILGLKLKTSSYKLQSKSKWAKLKSFGKKLLSTRSVSQPLNFCHTEKEF